MAMKDSKLTDGSKIFIDDLFGGNASRKERGRKTV